MVPCNKRISGVALLRFRITWKKTTSKQLMEYVKGILYVHWYSPLQCHHSSGHHSDQGSDCSPGSFCRWHSPTWSSAVMSRRPSLKSKLRRPWAVSSSKKLKNTSLVSYRGLNSINNEPLLRTLQGRMGDKRGILNPGRNGFGRAWRYHSYRSMKPLSQNILRTSSESCLIISASLSISPTNSSRARQVCKLHGVFLRRTVPSRFLAGS